MQYKRSENFLLKEIAGDHMLIARGSATIDFSSVVLFNETGVFLWQHMDEYRSPEELAELLAAEFNAPVDAVLADTRAFLDKMQDEGMVTVKED